MFRSLFQATFHAVEISLQDVGMSSVLKDGLRSYILILSFNLYLCTPSNLFPSGSVTKNIYAFLFPAFRATWSTYLTLLDLIFLVVFR
jgi:hypothetical protein